VYDYVSWREEGVWTAHCPAIPGAYGLGATSAQAVADLKDALYELDDYLSELGEKLPPAAAIRTGELRL
jgi:predicted RNase H-like HicB family nuclease